MIGVLFADIFYFENVHCFLGTENLGLSDPSDPSDPSDKSDPSDPSDPSDIFIDYFRCKFTKKMCSMLFFVKKVSLILKNARYMR